jgi:predicted Zn-dependent protease
MPEQSRNKIILIIFAISLLVGGCTTIYNPATERRESYIINTQQEISLGKYMDRQVAQEFKILKDDAMQKRLDRIGDRIAKVSDRQDVAYVFKIVKDKELNAFAVPGGYIYVNSGLMEAANDDELACVLAHEVGHIAARHSIKKLEAVLGYQIVLNLALGLGAPGDMAQATDIVFSLTSLGYSRKDELLSDKLSVRYTMRAGYDPRAMITFFNKLKEEEKKRGPNLKIEFLRSHPELDKRIAQIEEEVKKAENGESKK